MEPESAMRDLTAMETVVAIMAKAPRPGEVKTRLCPPLAPEEAADLARAFVLDAVERVAGVDRSAVVIAFAPAEAAGEFRALAPGVSLIPQRGGDLGERMAGVFEDLQAAGARRVVLMGTDAPTLPRAHVDEAVRRLAGDADVVLGPSEDGGYHLIGLGAPHPELFRDMAWSTPAVLAETRARARIRGLRVAELPAWFDVDTGLDLERLERELAAADGGARHTRAALAARAARVPSR